MSMTRKRAAEMPLEEPRLAMTEEGLSLCGGDLKLLPDLRTMLPRIENGKWQHEMLAKAAKLRDAGDAPVAVDATAGLGEDSVILAAAGFQVHMFEQDPVIAALLRDALRRAALDERLAGTTERLVLHEEDSIAALKSGRFHPDIVYLDPMFPERAKSGLIKKKFQLLQRLERPCGNEEELLSAALTAEPRRIIIKRPARGAHLAGRKPDYSITGKAVRYDCLVLR